MKNKLNLNLVLIATVILLSSVSSRSHPRQLTSSLSRGSTLSVENDSDKLVSPNRVFTCGFILVGANAYTFSIWFTNSADKTKVWTAKWGLIVNGKGSLLTFREDGGVVLTDIDGMLYDGPDISSIYWPNPDYDTWENSRTIYNSSRYGVLNEFGQFSASDRFSFEASDLGLGIIRRLTLDSDGNLRLYSLNNSSGTWLVTWIAFELLCYVHGLCGKNGLCIYTQSRVTCSCPPNYEVSDPSDWNKGCKPKFKINCHEPNSTTFVKLPHSDFWGYDLDFQKNVSLSHCKNLCKRECTCQAIQYIKRNGMCYTKIALFNGKSFISMEGSIYFKVPKNARMSRVDEPEALNLICNNISDDVGSGSTHLYTKKGSKINWVYFYGFVAALGLIEILFGILGWCFVYKRGINASLAEQGYELMGSQFRKFTFKELRKTTQNFKEVIGMGGSGTVYKGKLEDERAIAVKKLKDVIQGEEEFWAELGQ
ncbi:S-locus lectin protein kinase family protein [Carex littledalei]|uniref:non-specific serine/threonine protein kinase n=1 Tax=Carex littledalei TaxID=544730 RepID=A0A833QK27_9POAL|nr:S-locus lectin protein kinase family protein [Carex littledalei]